MARMTAFEKWFVNRRGEQTFVKLLTELEKAAVVHIDNNSRILELGGGNGAFSSMLFDRYHPRLVILTDLDPDQVAVARSLLKKKYGSLPNSFNLGQADATHLPYKNESFDIVVAHLILHHLGTKEEVFLGLDEISRVLASHGQFIYAEFEHKNEIREHLSHSGFEISFRKVGIQREVVVAVKV
ncbi:MAG: class I SAM-dependent methyltransferase [Thermoplasmatales archaeon]